MNIHLWSLFEWYFSLPGRIWLGEEMLFVWQAQLADNPDNKKNNRRDEQRCEYNYGEACPGKCGYKRNHISGDCVKHDVLDQRCTLHFNSLPG